MATIPALRPGIPRAVHIGEYSMAVSRLRRSGEEVGLRSYKPGRGYAAIGLQRGKTVHLLGISFSSAEKGIMAWEEERL